MGVNEFYYNNGVAITSEEAHALTDKSKLIVADRVVQKAECTAILSANIMNEEITEEIPQEEETPEEPTEPEE